MFAETSLLIRDKEFADGWSKLQGWVKGIKAYRWQSQDARRLSTLCKLKSPARFLA
jgi:hypothetical protein